MFEILVNRLSMFTFPQEYVSLADVDHPV